MKVVRLLIRITVHSGVVFLCCYLGFFGDHSYQAYKKLVHKRHALHQQYTRIKGDNTALEDRIDHFSHTVHPDLLEERAWNLFYTLKKDEKVIILEKKLRNNEKKD